VVRSFIVPALILAAAVNAACLDRLISRGQEPASVKPAAQARQSAGIVAGAPIVAGSSTLRLPSEPDGPARIPVAAYGNLILLRTGPQGGTSGPPIYESWDPASGAVSAVANWPAAEAARERITGASGDWLVVVRDQGPSSSTATVVLRNLKTGEARAIGSSGDSNGPPRVAAAEGWAAWFDGSSTPAMMHVYDINGSTDRTFAVRSRNISYLAVGNGAVAWWQSFGSQAPQILVRDAASSKFDSIPANSVTALALSGDGHTAVWIQGSSSSNPGLFVRDLATGQGGRLLGGQAVGVSLSASGPYISWQPGGGGQVSAAGIYNAQTHELRIVQPASGSIPRLARLMGRWFVWSEVPAQTSAGASLGSGCCFFVRLSN
jgi:hypothetical protein